MRTLTGLLLVLLFSVSAWAYNAPTLPTEFDPGVTPTASVFKSVCATVNVSGATNASPTVITTSATHYWVTGQTVTIASVGGNTGVNGSRVVTKIDSTHFSVPVDTSAGSPYTNGGTVACDYSNLQTAITAAANGWEIQLNQAEVYIAPVAGFATFVSNGFILPAKSGTTYVTIRTYPNANLPADNVRIRQSHRQYMAKIQNGTTNLANSKTSLTCDKNTSYWWIKAIDFTLPTGKIASTAGAMIDCNVQQNGATFAVGAPPKKTITDVTFSGSTVTMTLDIPSHGDMRLNTNHVIRVTCPACGVTGIDGNDYTITRVPGAVCTGATTCQITFTQAGVAGTFTSGAGQYVALSPTMYPDHIVYDQLWIDGESDYQSDVKTNPHFKSVGINLTGTYQAIINSQIHVLGGANCEQGLAITGTTGPQVAMIRNNSLSGSDMTWFFGGSDPNVPNYGPQDIVIRQNEMFKRTGLLQHQSDRSSNVYWNNVSGNQICSKNSMEMKFLKRLLLEGNTIDHTSFLGAQAGAGLHFTSRQGDANATECGTVPGTAGSAGCAPETETSDLTYRNNLFRYGGGCLDLTGQAGQTGIYATVRGSKFLYQNNLFIGCPGFGNAALSTISIGGGPLDVTFLHNTFVRPVSKASGAGFQITCSNSECEGGTNPNDIRTGALVRLTFQDNIIQSHTSRGVVAVAGDNVYQGCTSALFATYAPSAVWDHNIGIGALGSCDAPNGTTLATGTQIVATEAAMNFRDYDKHDYCLTASSPGYHAASDGTNVGVDMAALYEAMGLSYGPGSCP